MVSTQKMPTPIWVARQPLCAMNHCSTGGQIAPPR